MISGLRKGGTKNSPSSAAIELKPKAESIIMKNPSSFITGNNRLMTYSGLFRVLGFAALSVCASQVAQAQSVWNGTGTAWSTATDWTPNTVPLSTGNYAEFDSAFTNQPTMAGNSSALGLWVTGTGTTGNAGLTTIGGTGTLTLSNTAVLGSTTASILLDGSGNNSLTINTAVTAANGIFTVNNGGTLTMSSTSTGTGTGSTGTYTNNSTGSLNVTGTAGGNSSVFTNNSTGTMTFGTITGSNQVFNNNGAGTITVTTWTGGGTGDQINGTNASAVFNLGSESGVATLTDNSAGVVNITGTVAGLGTNGLIINNGSTGILNFTGSSSLTSVKGILLSSGTLNLASANTLTAGPLTITGAAGSSSVILGASQSGTINLGGPSGANPQPTSNVTTSISSSTALTGANSVGSSIFINTEGTIALTLGGSNAVGAANDMTFSGGNFTNLDSATVTIGTGSNITFTGGTFTLLTRGIANQLFRINGTGNLTINDTVTSTNTTGSSNSLTYSGTGTLALGGANTYAGVTSVTSGFLLATNTTGSATSAGAVTVSGTGSLGGTGTINTSGVTTVNASAVDIKTGATLSPSNGGTGFSHLNLQLNTNTFVNLESGSKLAFNLGGTSTSDEVLVTGGKVSLSGQDWNSFTFNALGDFTGGTYTLIDSPNGFSGTLGSLVTGTFDDGLYTGTLVLTGTDLDLDVDAVVIPEPGTWAMVLGGFVLLVLVQRRKAGRNHLQS